MSTSKPCPKWASEAIANLKEMEIFLGHLPKTAGWRSEPLQEVFSRAIGQDMAQINDSHSELFFGRIVNGLAKEGFDAETIAEFINAVLNYPKGPRYCNKDEVASTLGVETF